MMKRITLLTALLVAAAAQMNAQTGRDIIQRVKDRPDGNTRYAEMQLTLIKKNGDKRERKMVSWAMDEGKDTKKIMFFTYPGDVKGTGFLTWDYDQAGKEDDKWLYLPAMKKTRRISGSSSKTDYFMGTDFTYDDMGGRNVDDDTHKLCAKRLVTDTSAGSSNPSRRMPARSTAASSPGSARTAIPPCMWSSMTSWISFTG
jgi:Protein of unknown function (DUF1329).